MNRCSAAIHVPVLCTVLRGSSTHFAGKLRLKEAPVTLGSYSSLAAAKLDIIGGQEFRAASKAAETVGAQIVLGDRPIEITLERAWKALSLSRKIKLCSELVGANVAAASQV